MRRLLSVGVALILVLSLSGCGDGDDRTIVGPGFVGIDDSTIDTAPLLTVTYQDPFLGPVTAEIFSDPLLDGDIALVDPARGVFIVTTDATPLFFGVDSADDNVPEYMAFLTFPLDGSTGQDVVPSGVLILSATLELFVTQVSFAGTVPAFLDLVPYGVLGPEDFDAGFLDFLSLDFFSSDAGIYVIFEITPLMETAQARNLLDFQIRLSLDDGVSTAGAGAIRPEAVRKKAERTVSSFSIAGKRPARASRTGRSSPEAGAGRNPRSR